MLLCVGTRLLAEPTATVAHHKGEVNGRKAGRLTIVYRHAVYDCASSALDCVAAVAPLARLEWSILTDGAGKLDDMKQLYPPAVESSDPLPAPQ